MLHTHRACSACPRHATQNALAGRTDISWLRICAELQVGWNWGGSHAEGHVEDVIPHDATIESKGKEIKRKGTEENPAVVVSNDKPGGNPVIKKASELHTFKEVRTRAAATQRCACWCGCHRRSICVACTADCLTYDKRAPSRSVCFATHDIRTGHHPWQLWSASAAAGLGHRFTKCMHAGRGNSKE